VKQPTLEQQRLAFDRGFPHRRPESIARSLWAYAGRTDDYTCTNFDTETGDVRCIHTSRADHHSCALCFPDD
jgi:hypothetical protein